MLTIQDFRRVMIEAIVFGNRLPESKAETYYLLLVINGMHPNPYRLSLSGPRTISRDRAIKEGFAILHHYLPDEVCERIQEAAQEILSGKPGHGQRWVTLPLLCGAGPQ